MFLLCFFKQKTAYEMRISDWSSDVCSSDLASADYPVVTRLAHIPASVAEVDQLFDSANVIVTTMHIAGRADPQVQEQMAARTAALFIDEAHHIGARTWTEFRGLFVDRTPPIPIVQFTATPFREDRSEEHTSELQSLIRPS